jgi:predicted dithiol-disulfide oxidoreductase (DUF899 family)
METPPIVTPQEWKTAREQLLVREKEVTRARDALAAQRRRMPWLPVEKEYAFDGPKGSASLLDLFEDRRQLIIYRAFFEPGVVGWPDHACHGCSMMADQVADPVHLNARDITFAYASRAPQPDIARLKERMGWNWPWYTITSDWDVDFGVDEYHGTNAFIRDGDRVFRTYFVDNRGDEALGSTWSYLDLAALGRQETWEDSPEGYPQSAPYNWWNWHDEYDHPEMAQGPMKGWGMLRSDYRTASRPGAARGLHRGPGPPACPCRPGTPAVTRRLRQQTRPLDGLRVRQLKTCFGVADPDPDAPLEDKLRVRARVMADWFAAHPDRDALKRDLESARLAWADIRHAGDVLAAPSLAGRDTVVEVTDGDGEKRPVARMPYRFSDAASGPVRGVPEPGEHTDDVLRDWTGHPDLPPGPRRERHETAYPVPGVPSAARVAVARPNLSPATTATPHHRGQDHCRVTSPWFRSQARCKE